jgi:hypothetical protein
LLRFVGGWLSGALTAAIALPPLWADVWSRLGPSEIYGAACVGVMLFSANAILFSANSIVRNAGAIVLAVATVFLAGMKETFFPLAAGTAGVFVFAVTAERLSAAVVGCLAFVIAICLGGIILVIAKGALATGTDYYGQSVGPWRVLFFAGWGFLAALLQTWRLWALPIAFFQMLRVMPYKPLRCLVTLRCLVVRSREAATMYIFLVTMYAAQCGLYRMILPHHSRYDFPSMLLVPLVICVLACDFFYKLRRLLPERTINYAQLTAAIFLTAALANVYVGNVPALSKAVEINIEATNTFYGELQRLVRSANESPKSPIILEAYGPFAIEPVFSLSTYIRVLGPQNPISVRFHSDDRSNTVPLDGLRRRLFDLQNAPTGTFVPLVEVLSAKGEQRCLSVGIIGPADVACSAFEIKTP